MTSAAQSPSRRLEAGTLWEQVRTTTQGALEAGTLEPLPVSLESAPDAGIRFAVRVLTPSDRKRHHTERQKDRGQNPFLPYEQAMFVCDISPTHLCLLNKFPSEKKTDLKFQKKNSHLGKKLRRALGYHKRYGKKRFKASSKKFGLLNATCAAAAWAMGPQ